MNLPDIRSHADEDLRQLVTMTDVNLEFIRDMHPDATSCRTLLVAEDGQKYVLKIRAHSNNIWDDLYFYHEIYALHRSGERNLKHVTHLVREYKTETHHAILKTYAEGTPVDRLDPETLLRDRDFIRKLDDLYMELHLAGISKVNFEPRKVVMDDDGELTLVDMSTCVVNTEAGILQFAQELRTDSGFITRLEKQARRAVA